jgi:hypothetical protein
MNEPMPLKLDVTTGFKVINSNGRLLRSEELPAGTALPDRLRLAHRNYQLQGWSVEPLLPRSLELPRREGRPAPPHRNPTPAALRAPVLETLHDIQHRGHVP